MRNCWHSNVISVADTLTPLFNFAFTSNNIYFITPSKLRRHVLAFGSGGKTRFAVLDENQLHMHKNSELSLAAQGFWFEGSRGNCSEGGRPGG